MIAIRNIRKGGLMILCALMIFMTLLTVRPQVTYACSCVVPAPPLEALEKSAAVFEGTVTSIKKTVKPMQSSIDPVHVTFQVGSLWKGELGDQVTVITALSGGSCGFEFTKGERYLVYARDEGAEGNGGATKLTVSLCSRTALFSEELEDLKELGAGSGGSSPTAPPEIAEGDGSAVPEADDSAAAPWLLYVGIGAGAAVLIAATLILLRHHSNKSRK